MSGGLAGDGPHFAETLVGCNGKPASNTVAAVGFYGDAIQFGHGSAGGWDVFGPKRRITGSTGNVLLEVDGKPALDLYKLYLGPEESQNLPGSALLFPMRISDPKHPDQSVVRTVLAVDAETGSMTFAGDMPEGLDRAIDARQLHAALRRRRRSDADRDGRAWRPRRRR